MRIPRPRAGARTGRAAVGVLLLAAAFLALPTGPAKGDPEVAPQSASMSSGEAPTPELKALIADDPAEGLPGFSDLPPTPGTLTSGTVTNSQIAISRRSKMAITSRLIWGGLYFGQFNSPIENPTSFKATCTTASPYCIPDPFYQPSCATDDPATQWVTAYTRHLMYPLNPLKSGGAEVGVLIKDKINLIAFGTIPATATLTLFVPRVNGKVPPLKIHGWDRKPNKGCVPIPADIPRTSTLLEGKVTVQLSDLVVDGVPVDLGPRCRTREPTDLYVWGKVTPGDRENTYFPGSGGPLGAYAGLHPGSRGPLNDPYYLEDNGRTIPPSSGIDIPPFTNCGAGGDDLSPLVTAMASGPNNPVSARQGPIVPLNRIPLEDISMCARTLCPLPAPDVPARPPLPDGEGQ